MLILVVILAIFAIILLRCEPIRFLLVILGEAIFLSTPWWAWIIIILLLLILLGK